MKVGLISTETINSLDNTGFVRYRDEHSRGNKVNRSSSQALSQEAEEQKDEEEVAEESVRMRRDGENTDRSPA